MVREKEVDDAGADHAGELGVGDALVETVEGAWHFLAVDEQPDILRPADHVGDVGDVDLDPCAVELAGAAGLLELEDELCGRAVWKQAVGEGAVGGLGGADVGEDDRPEIEVLGDLEARRLASDAERIDVVRPAPVPVPRERFGDGDRYRVDVATRVRIPPGSFEPIGTAARERLDRDRLGTRA